VAKRKPPSQVLCCADCGAPDDADMNTMIHLPLLVPDHAGPVFLCRVCCQRRWARSAPVDATQRSIIGGMVGKVRVRVKAICRRLAA